MEDRKFNVSVTLESEVTQYDIAVLIEMAGYGINYWAQSAYDDGERYQVWYEDIEGDPTTIMARTATYQELADALAHVAMHNHGYVGEYARRYFRDSDAGEIDSELADLVVQQALFGQTIYG